MFPKRPQGVPLDSNKTGGSIDISASFVCSCTHETCYLARGWDDHYRECDCPKETDLVALCVMIDDDDPASAIQWFLSPKEARAWIAEVGAGVERAIAVMTDE